jgi:hypothetical protein
MNQTIKTAWKVNTPGLLKEIVNNNKHMSVLATPLQIFAHLLGEVATRASELNDPELNALMCRLALYEISDPYSKEYDDKLTKKIINQSRRK